MVQHYDHSFNRNIIIFFLFVYYMWFIYMKQEEINNKYIFITKFKK